MTNPWSYLDGKKTVLGSSALWLSSAISQVAVGVWQLPLPWLDPAADTLLWLGMALVPAGLAHKAVKLRTGMPPRA